MARAEDFRGRLEVAVGVGLLVGVVYTLVDAFLDQRFSAVAAPTHRWVDAFHGLIDLVLPTLVGGLSGLAVHYLNVRAKMVAIERDRADLLSRNLHKIERDQAVWVISASLLHELKNPLHSLGLLLDELSELPPEAHAERGQLLGRARKQSDRIAGQLAALRGLPSSQTPELPTLDARVQVERIVSEVSEGLRDRKLQCRVTGESCLVRANPAYLRIILENLLDNASEAAEESAAGAASRPREVTVEVAIRPGRQRCFIEVTDNGPGIDPQVRAHLFEPFQTTKSSGMGLGLAIARTLCRGMGGELSLVDGADHSTFRLELEVAQ